jgi:L-glyceraldehyde 3-phosphate reductase
MLTDRYAQGVPAGSRAEQGKSLDPAMAHDDNLARVRGLAGVARERGQSERAARINCARPLLPRSILSSLQRRLLRSTSTPSRPVSTCGAISRASIRTQGAARTRMPRVRWIVRRTSGPVVQLRM